MPVAETAVPRKTIKTTTVTTSENTANDAEPLPFYRRDFWEIINTLTPDDWTDHLVRVYRADERWENDVAPEGNKLNERFDEDFIRAKWGGGRYNLWLYGPPSGTKVVRRPFRLMLAGAPKFSHSGSGNGNGEDGTLKMVLSELLQEIRASRGGNVAQSALQGALDLQAAALKSGVETVRSLNPAAAAPPAEKSTLEKALEKYLEVQLTKMLSGDGDSFQKKFQEVMFDRMLNPANPIQQVREIMTAVKDISGGPGKTDFAAIANTFVGQLPTIIDKATNSVREYRLANESAERVFRLQKDHGLNNGDVIDMPPGNGAAAAPAAASVQPPPSNTPTPEVVEVKGPSIEYVQARIVQIIEEKTDCTGEDLYDFLFWTANELNAQLGAQSPEGLLAIFKSQPILSKVADNPRLPKIIDEYLAYVKELAKAKPV